MIEHSRKVLIKVGYACNNNCVFCHSYDLRSNEDLTIRNVFEKIKKAKALNAEMAVFSGGEPTIRKDFVTLIQIVKSCGLRIGIVTNGRRFACETFLKTVLRFPVSYVYVSLHGATENTHNAQVRSNAFQQTLQGIQNISKENVFLTVNVVVNKSNIGELSSIADLLRSLNLRLKFSLLEPKGAALNHFQELALHPCLAAQEVSKVIHGIIHDGGKLRIGCDGFTPCLIKNYEAVNMDLFTDNFLYMTELYEKEFFKVDYGDRGYSDDCSECSFRARCPGIYKEYLNLYKDVFTPVLETKPNSFFYIPAGKLSWHNENQCPLNKELNGYNPDRELFMRGCGDISLYRTETADFSNSTLREVKEDEQLYFNVTAKVKRIHYGRDLRKLKIISLCSTCERKSLCPRVYELTKGNVFEDFEKEIHSELSGLKGTVCDVGCGELRYFEVLKTLILSGSITYVGVDPKKTVPKSKKIKYVKTSIEALDLPPETFEHVLVLCSYNHFMSLKKAFHVMCKILKTNGKILIVENIPFGMLRRKNAFLPRKVKPVFEHFRNHGLNDAVNFLQGYPLKIVRTKGVTKESCNQWMLVAQKQ